MYACMHDRFSGRSMYVSCMICAWYPCMLATQAARERLRKIQALVDGSDTQPEPIPEMTAGLNRARGMQHAFGIISNYRSPGDCLS